MKIAVSYENGNVFQHFGKTEAFKVYETENGHILSAKIVGTDGAGHEALADYLAGLGVEVLICGGLGEGAKNALSEQGIQVCSGAEGNADDAVEAFLGGELTDAGVNCHHHHHHHHEEEGCHSHCGGGCHSCGGGCGGMHITLEGKNAGKLCRVHYRGTFNDGTQFDCSYDRGEPLEFICGAGMMIPGFDAAVVNMEVGEKINIHLLPEDAYGQVNPNAILTIEVDRLPGAEDLKVGDRVYLSGNDGQPVPVTVTAREGSTITFDANHEMAGKELNFEIELVEVQ